MGADLANMLLVGAVKDLERGLQDHALESSLFHKIPLFSFGRPARGRWTSSSQL